MHDIYISHPFAAPSITLIMPVAAAIYYIRHIQCNNIDYICTGCTLILSLENQTI